MSQRRKSKAPFIIAIVAASVVLLIATIVVAISLQEPSSSNGADDDQTDQTSDAGNQDGGAELPAAGVYQMQTIDGKFCVGAGPEPANPERTVFILDDCTKAAPPLELSVTDGGGYRIGVNFKEEDYQACLSADKPADSVGYLVSPWHCPDAEFQDLTMEPAGGGLQVTVTDAQLCVGPLDGKVEQGQAMSVVECSADDPSQIFMFTPAG